MKRTILIALAFLLVASVAGAETSYILTWETESIFIGGSPRVGAELFKSKKDAVEYINKHSGSAMQNWALFEATEVPLTKTEAIPAVPEKYSLAEDAVVRYCFDRYMDLRNNVEISPSIVWDTSFEDMVHVWSNGTQITVEYNCLNQNQRSYHTNRRLTRDDELEAEKVKGVAYTSRYSGDYELSVQIAKLFITDWPRIQDEIFKVLCK